MVIVTASNPTQELSRNQIADIYLGKTPYFPDGESAQPGDQSEGNLARDEFYLKIIGKAAPQMTAYWSKMIFTGQGRPPPVIGDSVAVKRRVATSPNAVGYINRSALDSSVRAVLTLD